MQRISYWILRALAESFRLVPFWLLYRLSDMLAFLFEQVIGYRKQVMLDNLRRSFPEKTPEELHKILRAAYRNLTDITLETIKGFTVAQAELNRRCTYANPELANAYLERGQSLVIAGSHINSWEWPCMTLPLALHAPTFSVYKPLSNKIVDRYYNRRRGRAGMIMISMDDTFAVLRKHAQETGAYFFLSDQSPSSRKSVHWVRFLNQDTAFMPGVDFLARRFKYPVLYFHCERLRRGYYQVTFYEICTDPAAATEQEISRAYAALVENIIQKQPENWLWSHRRWKHKP